MQSEQQRSSQQGEQDVDLGFITGNPIQDVHAQYNADLTMPEVVTAMRIGTRMGFGGVKDRASLPV